MVVFVVQRSDWLIGCDAISGPEPKVDLDFVLIKPGRSDLSAAS
jgi:hypothetical protein